jgi:hypothetical protein
MIPKEMDEWRNNYLTSWSVLNAKENKNRRELERDPG